MFFNYILSPRLYKVYRDGPIQVITYHFYVILTYGCNNIYIYPQICSFFSFSLSHTHTFLNWIVTNARVTIKMLQPINFVNFFYL